MIIHFLSALLSVASADPPTPVPAAPSTSPSPHGGPGGRATLFISPMGEPFRGQATRAAALDAWFAGADKDGNRLLSNQEMRDDAARYFATLDRVHDSEIDPDDLSYYESQIFPEVRMIGTGPGRGARYARIPGGNSTGDYGRGTDAGERLSSAGSGGGSGTLKRIPSGPEVGLKGAGRWGLLNIPHPLTPADADFNRGISLAEFQKAATARFLLLDTDRDGKLPLDELQARLATLPSL